LAYTGPELSKRPFTINGDFQRPLLRTCDPTDDCRTPSNTASGPISNEAPASKLTVPLKIPERIKIDSPLCNWYFLSSSAINSILLDCALTIDTLIMTKHMSVKTFDIFSGLLIGRNKSTVVIDSQ
jgi:hypothetical protein